MVNIKETIYVWIAIVGIAAGCAFSYGFSSIIFEDIQEDVAMGAPVEVDSGDDLSQAAAAIGAVRAAARGEGRTPQAILADIAAAEAQIAVQQKRIADLRAELAAIKPIVTVGYNASGTADRVSYNNFTAGTGQQNTSRGDFLFEMGLTNYASVTINKITLIHTLAREGWSTSNNTNNELNKVLYPLVVDAGQDATITPVFHQVNTAYNQPLGTYTAVGTGKKPHMFRLYGQPEKVPFTGGTLYVEFSNGYVAQIPVKGLAGTPAVPGSPQAEAPFRVSLHGRPSATVIYSPASGPGAEIGLFSISFDITALAGNVYIDKSIFQTSASGTAISGVGTGFAYGVSSGDRTVASGTVITAVGDSARDTADAFQVASGTTRTFNLEVRRQAVSAALTSVDLRGINWSRSASLIDKYYTANLGDLRTPPLVLVVR